MLLKEIQEKFELGKIKNNFRRINENFKGNLFIGSSDNLPTIIIKEKSQKLEVESSKYVLANIVQVEDSYVYLTFQLLDLSLYEIFLKFCEDLILNLEQIDKDKMIGFAIARWNLWKKVFKDKKNSILSEKEIMGLIGELLFLKNHMMEQYSIGQAIDAWNGPEKASKDFEVEKEWIEIKCKKRTSDQITINSLEQLDSENEGYLVINTLEKISENVENSINLNKLVNEIDSMILEYDLKIKFKEKLWKYGYIIYKEYDEWNYKFLREEIYSVKDTFPRIKKSALEKGITEVAYKISVESIDRFKIQEELWKK